MNLNKVFIIGNLTRDPEVRTTPAGQNVANFGVATNRIFNDKTGQRQQQVEFHNVVAWGKLSDIAGQYLNKGKMVFVEGRLQTRNWQGQDGAKKFKTEIIAERLQLGPKFSKDFTSQAPETKEESIPTIDAETPPAEDDIKAEELPF